MKTRISLLCMLPAALLAGPYPADFIPAADPRLVFWASVAELIRGPGDIAQFDPETPYFADYGDESSAIGPAGAIAGDDGVGNPYPVVSLGDGGSATLTFDQPLADGAGPDFAVFENSFNGTFLELAHVEVSSDGVNFFRFPSISLTQISTQIPDYGTLDPSNIHNLAGRAPGGSGTPFDLAELRRHHPALDVDRITHVRVVDVVGMLPPNEGPALGSFDSLGNPINDPYPTFHEFSGFDLDAVGAISPMVTTYAAWTASWDFTGNDALPTADPDHDGIPNLIRYLTGNGSLAMKTTPAQTTLSFPRLAYRTDGKLRVEGSATLADWQPLAESVAGASTIPTPGSPATVLESGTDLVHVTITVPSGSGKRYFRLTAQP